MYESYCEFLDSVQPDTIFTVVASLSIFVAGLVAKFIYDSWRKRRYLKSRVRFFVDAAESITKSIEKQAKEYENLAEQVCDINNHRPVFNRNTGINLFFFTPDIIADIHAFISLKWCVKLDYRVIKEVSQVVKTLDLQLEHTRYNINSYIKLQSENSYEWFESTNKVLRFFDSWGKEHKKSESPMSDNFFLDFDTVLSNFNQDEGNEDLVYAKENLVDPLLKVCYSYSSDERAITVIPFLKSAAYAYERLTANDQSYQKLFINDAEQLKKLLTRYKSALKDLRKLI